MAGDGTRRDSFPKQESRVILLVEDEDSVRKVVREMLRRNGFSVLEANGGDQALEICTKNANSIDAVLSDISMPDMSGLELATRLQRLVPKWKWLFMSGYCEEALWRDYSVLVAEIPFIQKPFKPDGLIKKLREILEPAQELSAAVRAPRASSRFRPVADSPELVSPRRLSLARRIERLRSETWHAWENFSFALYEFNILQANYARLQQAEASSRA